MLATWRTATEHNIGNSFEHKNNIKCTTSNPELRVGIVTPCIKIITPYFHHSTVKVSTSTFKPCFLTLVLYLIK